MDLFAFFVAVGVAVFCGANGNLIVTTNNGKIQGKRYLDRKGNEYFSFLSIPYAKPPLGPLRFKAPEPVENWTNIRDGTVTVPYCPQEHIIITDWVIGQEDCLYLNVYTPKLPDDNGTSLDKAVMVFIHGGAYLKGSSKRYGPEFLMPEDVVLVTINYRLGLLGYLNMEDETLGVPGNAGFKDQVLALQWVRDNIKQFGGDPNNVTLIGESCGATSVHLHILSPMSKGLFHRAILQSGTGLNAWAPSVRNTGMLLGKQLNLDTQNEAAMLAKLRTVPMMDLLKAQFNINSFISITKQMRVGHVVEKKSNETPFLSDEPENIIRSGNYNNVPILMGYNSQEGILIEIAVKARFSNFYSIRNVTKNLPFTLLVDREHVPEIDETVKKFYFNERSDFNSTVTYLTDTWFAHDIFKTAVLHSNNPNATVYFYKFSANTLLNLCKYLLPGFTEYEGASHLDELAYLFTMLHTPRIDQNSIEDKSIDKMVRLWTNFAKFGNPTPENENRIGVLWKPFSKELNNVLEIGNTFKYWNANDYERVVFWKKIYDKYLTNKSGY